MEEIKKVVKDWLIKEGIIHKTEAIDKLVIKIDKLNVEEYRETYNKGYKAAIEEVIATLEKQK